MAQDTYHATGEQEETPLLNNGVVTNQGLTGAAAALPTANLARRRTVIIQHVGAVETAFIGFSAAVTAGVADATRGWVMLPGAALSIDVGEDVTLFVIGSGVEANALQIMEI